MKNQFFLKKVMFFVLILFIAKPIAANNKNIELQFFEAAKTGKIDTIKEILEKNPQIINLTNKRGETALGNAIKSKNYNIIEILLQNGANPDIRKSGENTFLMWSILEDNKKIAELLLKYGTDPNIPNNYGMTAYDLAKKYNKKDFIKLIEESDYFNPQNLIILIEDKPTENAATLSTLVKAIESKSSPIIIFGKKLFLQSIPYIKEKPSINKNDFLFFKIDPEDIGFLLLPKHFLNKNIKENSKQNLTNEEIIKNLNFLIPPNYFIEIKNLDEYMLSALEKKEPSFNRFNLQVPEIINKILKIKNRCIFISGHGAPLKYKFSLGLKIDSAIKLLKILEDRGTSFVFIKTCFLGGNTLNYVENKLFFINSNIEKKYKSSNMIIASGATTESSIIGGSSPNFISFFDSYKTYLKKKIKSLNAKLIYFAKNILNHISGGEYINNFPQIRFPYENAKFYTVPIGNAVQVINQVSHSIAKLEKTPIIIDNKILLMINVPKVEVPIKFFDNVPLILTPNSNYTKYEFKELEVKIDYIQIADFFKKAFYREEIFKVYPYKNLIIIKKLVFPTENTIESIKIPKVLENIFIHRGPNLSCYALFNLNQTIHKYDIQNNKIETIDFLYNKNLWEENPEYINFLIKKKLIQINKKEQGGFTQLMFTITTQDYEMVKLLLQHGANPNIQNDYGLTALMLSINLKNKSIAELLLKYGADPKIKNKSGETAFDIAKKINAKEILELLETYKK